MIKEPLNKIVDVAKKYKTKSIAKISVLLNLHRDTVKRRLKTLRAREHHPCSTAFETASGQQWLQLLLVLCVFYFGIKSNVGAATLSEFLTMLGVGLYLGVSSGSVKRLEQKMDELISQFGEHQQSLLLPLAKNIDIRAGADETFFEQHNVLVFMDLVSGFIMKEEIQQKRTLLIWKATVLKCTLYFKSFTSLISDGSQVLKKLSTVLQSIHFSDLFHLLQYVSSMMRFQFSAKLKSVDKQITNTSDDSILVELTKKRQLLLDGQHQFRKELQIISLAVNPFSIEQSVAMTSDAVKKILLQSLHSLEAIKINCELSDKKKKLSTFKNQLQDVAAQIDEWWKWSEQSIIHYHVSNEMRFWLLHVLLPMQYWKQQLKKCRNKKLKPFYEKALLAATHQYDNHPLTLAMNDPQWIAWATWISSLFQRTTSAIEGRNGVLSLVSHFSRGLSKQRLNSLTVIHNFHIQREDHTTAAQRLFKTSHGSLLEYLIEQMVCFPHPRSYKINTIQEPLYLKIKAA